MQSTRSSTSITRLLAWLIGVVCLLPGGVAGQSDERMAGHVWDAATRQPVQGANVEVVGAGFGAATDAGGYFFITDLPAGIYDIRASHVGYEPMVRRGMAVAVDGALRVDFRLRPRVIQLGEVSVEAAREVLDSDVLDRARLGADQHSSLAQALAVLPGVEVQSGSGRELISIRGCRPNQVLVLLDGVAMNDAVGGEADLAEIPMSIIESVEVYRGSAAARFGSGAVGGAVVVTTRRREGVLSGVGFRGGSFGEQSVTPQIGFDLASARVALIAEASDRQGGFPYTTEDRAGRTIHDHRMNNAQRLRSILLRVELPGPQQRIRAESHFFESQTGLPGQLYALTPHAERRYRRFLGALRYRRDTALGSVNAIMNYQRTRTQHLNDVPDDAPLAHRSVPDYDARTDLLTTQFEMGLDRKHGHGSLTVSGGFRGQELDYRDLLVLAAPSERRVENRNKWLLMSSEWRPSDGALPLHLSLLTTLRGDLYQSQSANLSRRDRFLSPLVRLAVRPVTYVEMMTAWSRSFRMPTHSDMFFEGYRVIGNPELRPERARNIDAGAMLHLPRGVHVGADWFRNKINDMIIWRLGAFATFTPVNTNAEIRGVEYHCDFPLAGDWLLFSYSLSRLKPRNRSGERTTHNRVLPYRAQEMEKWSLTARAGGVELWIQNRRMGRRFITEANTVEAPPYRLVQVSADARLALLGGELHLGAVAQNLLDARYALIDRAPMPGREFHFTVGFHR